VSSLPTTLGAAVQIAVTGILADINVQDLMIPADAPDVVPAAWDQYLMGRAYAAAHTNEANALAAEAFAAALKIAPDFPAARIEHAFTRYYAQQGFEDDLTGPELPGLQVEVLAALQQEPGNPRGYELMSRLKLLDYTYLRAGDGERTNREQAMDFLERAVELAPGDPDLMSYRARLHTFARARSYYAEEYAEDAMRRHPWHDWTYTLHLAQNLQLQMVYDRALELLEPLAAAHPDVLRIRREAALVYGLARDVDRGRVHMEAALTIDPTYGAGWETEDAIYDNPGNFQRDMESLRRVGLP
jgi:tetratricopeptide (TPR) repeat protein